MEQHKHEPTSAQAELQGVLIQMSEPQTIAREVADVERLGLEIVEHNRRSWRVRLNYFPHVTQDCRHANWMIGVDGRVRPKPGWKVKPGGHRGAPRIKIAAPASRPLPPPSPTPPSPEASLLGRLQVVERQLAEVRQVLGLGSP